MSTTTPYFDFAANLARAQAAQAVPDANSGLSGYLEREFGSVAEARQDAYEKAKEAETDDLALDYLDTTDDAKAAALIRAFWEETEAMAPVQIIAAVREMRGPLLEAMKVAAKRLAVAEWERRYRS